MTLDVRPGYLRLATGNLPSAARDETESILGTSIKAVAHPEDNRDPGFGRRRAGGPGGRRP